MRDVLHLLDLIECAKDFPLLFLALGAIQSLLRYPLETRS